MNIYWSLLEPRKSLAPIMLNKFNKHFENKKEAPNAGASLISVY